jgi:hypothetical protein
MLMPQTGVGYWTEIPALGIPLLDCLDSL